MTLRYPIPLIALAATAALGAYRGMNACASHVSTRQLIHFAVLALLAAGAVALWVQLRRIPPALALLFAGGLLFFGAEALAASYYPSPPINAPDLFERFLHHLQRGPC